MRKIILLSIFALMYPCYLAYASSVTPAPGLPKTGGTLTGPIDMGGNEITNADISASETDPDAIRSDGTGTPPSATIPFGNQNITNAAEVEFDDGVLKAFTAGNNSSFYNSLQFTRDVTDAGYPAFFDFYHNGAAATEGIAIRVFGKGNASSTTDLHYAELGWNIFTGRYQLASQQFSDIPQPLDILIAADNEVDAVQAADITIQASNKTAGTGGGGDITLIPGTSAGGNEGAVIFASRDLDFTGSGATDFDRPAGGTFNFNLSGSTKLNIRNSGEVQLTDASSGGFQMINQTSTTTPPAGEIQVRPVSDRLTQEDSSGVEETFAFVSEVTAAVGETFTDTLTTAVDGLTTIRSVVLADDDIVNVIATCVGIKDDGAKVVGARRKVVYFKNGAASLARIGTMSTDYQKQTGGSPALVTDINDNGTDTVLIEVDGNAGETVNWKCKTEVIRENAA